MDHFARKFKAFVRETIQLEIATSTSRGNLQLQRKQTKIETYPRLDVVWHSRRNHDTVWWKLKPNLDVQVHEQSFKIPNQVACSEWPTWIHRSTFNTNDRWPNRAECNRLSMDVLTRKEQEDQRERVTQMESRWTFRSFSPLFSRIQFLITKSKAHIQIPGILSNVFVHSWFDSGRQSISLWKKI